MLSISCRIVLFSEQKKDQRGYGASLEVLQKTSIYFSLLLFLFFLDNLTAELGKWLPSFLSLLHCRFLGERGGYSPPPQT